MHNYKSKETCEGHTVLAEDYLRNKVLSANLSQVVDGFNEIIDQFVQLYKHEHSNKT